MIRAIVDHFPTFITRLNNPDFQMMRRQFETFFDEFHNP